MELSERAIFLSSLQKAFSNVEAGEGHCMLISGESGIGKTTLVKAFCKQQKDCRIYEGTCDALFTPRPLAPLYDIASQMKSDVLHNDRNVTDRASLFSNFFHELQSGEETTLLVIEDIHWADEATLDFIKFLARRITRLKCLLILTYRDNEIHFNHPLRNVLGQLSPDSFTRLQLTPLSRESVEKMANEKGYKGEDVYRITNGNPFYVNEVLASYSTGVPDNIKDSVLSSYNRLDEKTKQVWQILSVLPTGFEIKYLEKMEPLYEGAIHNCLDLKILIAQNGAISFKHELFRRTIETSLSPLLRISLNKRILELFKGSFEGNGEIERIIHHAKNANADDVVVHYAPVGARHAAAVGAHTEAARLYLTAIEYYQGSDKNMLIQLYEAYAYECYLTNQVKEAIIYTGRSLNLWKEKNNLEKIGNSLRFLSRLWWFDGNGKKAEAYALEAIEILSAQPPSKTKAMALSNMSQLKMLSDQRDECVAWGEKAIAMANELHDDETLCHALNNVGMIQMRVSSSRQNGIKMLQQSLEIATRNSYDEHVSRAYINLASNAVEMKDYAFAKRNIEDGLRFCEEKGIESCVTYLLLNKARLLFETGNWKEALTIATTLLEDESQSTIVRMGALVIVASIQMRKGGEGALSLLVEAKEMAFKAMEPQRIIPILIAMLEYEWITGTRVIADNDLDYVIPLKEEIRNIYRRSEFAFWLLKAREQNLGLPDYYEGYKLIDRQSAIHAATLWRRIGCAYEEALALFAGSETDKRKALSIMRSLGADAIYEKMKFDMRASGIRKIPRGIRKSTLDNAAHLTEREVDVLKLLKEGLQNKEIGARLFISPKTVDHHISSILFKLDVNSRTKAVNQAVKMQIIK